MAHLDRRAVVDPDGYVREGHVSYRQIEGLFEQTGLILNSLFQLYRGTTVPLDLIDASDYEQALDLIADAKCELGVRSPTTNRPHHCQGRTSAGNEQLH
jgi:hypothetical protein